MARSSIKLDWPQRKVTTLKDTDRPWTQCRTLHLQYVMVWRLSHTPECPWSVRWLHLHLTIWDCAGFLARPKAKKRSQLSKWFGSANLCWHGNSWWLLILHPLWRGCQQTKITSICVKVAFWESSNYLVDVMQACYSDVSTDANHLEWI